jgi:hypothetical protein
MLIEIWERLCGYDKWVQVEATVVSSELIEPMIKSSCNGSFFNKHPIKNPFVVWLSRCAIRWTDTSGGSHTANYSVSESSGLFLLYEGQTVSIRCNPANPEEFYNRSLYFKTGSLWSSYLLFTSFA